MRRVRAAGILALGALLAAACARDRARAWNARGEEFLASRGERGGAGLDLHHLVRMTGAYDWREYWRLQAPPPKYARARAAFERAVAIAPRVARYRCNLGVSLMGARQPVAAAAAFAEALHLDPTDQTARFGLAAARLAEHVRPAPGTAVLKAAAGPRS